MISRNRNMRKIGRNCIAKMLVPLRDASREWRESDLSLAKSHSPCDGFTLIELLVAAALFMILAVILIVATESVASLSSQASTKLEAERVGREAFDAIGRELSVAALPWAKSSTNSLQFIATPADLATNFQNPHSIFWQAPIARNKTYGNLAIVGYFVLRDIESDSSKTRLQLRRLFVEPTAAGLSTNYMIYDSPASWLTPAVIQEFAPSTSALDSQNAQKGWVADGILAMWVRCLDRSGNAITLNASGQANGYKFDSRAGYRSGSGTNDYSYPTNFQVLPAFVEVALVCVAPSEVRKITVLPGATASSPTNFSMEVTSFADAVRQANPSAKSVGVFSRKFRIYGGY